MIDGSAWPGEVVQRSPENPNRSSVPLSGPSGRNATAQMTADECSPMAQRYAGAVPGYARRAGSCRS